MGQRMKHANAPKKKNKPASNLVMLPGRAYKKKQEQSSAAPNHNQAAANTFCKIQSITK